MTIQHDHILDVFCKVVLDINESGMGFVQELVSVDPIEPLPAGVTEDDLNDEACRKFHDRRL